ncbi:MAG: c-type cytochrome [Gammaproteobacteria bacterium]|nr:c-type cytochrome [Gammaproteobacteria bacterium]MDH5799929.1 c-type cytochrome [Gammaproteobacteria bacterium]
MVQRSLPNSFYFLLLLSLSIPQQATALSSGITGQSGNPNTNAGSSCSACHTGGIPPSISLNGAINMEAGSSAGFTLIMSGGQQNLGGFNISATAGTLTPGSSNMVLEQRELKHSSPYSVGNAGVEWTFTFTAPVTTGVVTLYAAVVSADNDATMEGDSVALSSLDIEIVPAPGPIVPEAHISAPYAAQPGDSISLDASASVDGDGTISRYLWDFGDGSAFEQGAVVNHSYMNEGSYTITMAVTDNDKLTAAAATTVIINANAGSPEGEALYNQYCFACHGTGGFGGSAVAVVGATTTQITTALNNIAAMSAISVTNNEVQLIADFLLVGSTAPPPRPNDGPGLYGMFCSACHGIDGRGGIESGVSGASFPMIAAAIADIPAMQNISLSLEETQLVANFLTAGGSGSLPTDGAGLYRIFCAVCHGNGGHGGKFKAVTGAPSTMISAAIAAESWMNPLQLNATQLNAIGNFLSSGGSGPLPVDGAGLYGVFCSVCHGTDGRGGTYKVVTGTSLRFVENAINRIALMRSLQLDNTQQQLIVEFLASGGGGTKPVDGAGLYHVYCETCHGVNGQGGPVDNIVGATQSEINRAIVNKNDMQQLQPYLSTSGSGSDTGLISNFLTTQ